MVSGASSAASVRLARSSAAGETSIRWTVSRRPGTRPAATSVASFSPLPGPSSTSVESGSACARISRPRRASSARSARVMPYHGSWVIASKSAEPSPS
jgi:hypothetical protein